MEEPTAKGTVTSLSSMFPVDDAQRAAKRVQDAMAEKQQELDRVKGFIADNTNLINIVQKLPDELHHDIMVPFGKAAFFPGRLIHTNEFMVLLGEGYYAERTSKQTIDILMRREDVLHCQVDSLKAMMKDLQAEASFFHTTASEAAEGLVEIREEYEEENLSKRASESGPLKQSSPRLSKADNPKGNEDAEYAHIMSRLDELEKEEHDWEVENGNDEIKQSNKAESDNEDNEDGVEDEEYARIMSRFVEIEEEELAAETENGSGKNKLNITAECYAENNEDEQATVFNQFSNQISLDNLRYLEDKELNKPPAGTKKKVTFQDSDVRSCNGSTVQAVLKDAKPREKSLATNMKADSAGKALVLPEEDNVAAAPSSRKEVSPQTSKPGFDRHNAFTESIVEHDYNLPTIPREQIRNTSKPSESRPSKPLSRFKMQRR